jgi:hypothetical protein
MKKTPYNEVSFVSRDLKPLKVRPENLYLDPNNPRFLPLGKKIPEYRIKEEKIQKKTLEKIEKIGIADLIESISKYGFLTIDRVIVKPLDKNGNYIILEGNRRVAALKLVKEKHEEGDLTLDEKILESLEEIEVLVYNGSKEDIVWTIQGLRHLTGIKEWPKLQQAKFVTENFFEKKEMGFREIARLLNMKVPEVSTLIRSYYAFKQAKEDEEYGEYIEPDKFSIFNEGVFKKQSLKEWLEWSDRKKKFKNIENFRKLLSWITPPDEKIKRAIDVRDFLAKLVLENNRDILKKFENDEIDIDRAKIEITKKEVEKEIRDEFRNIKSILESIENISQEISQMPIANITISNPKSVKELEKLEKLLNKLTMVIKVKVREIQGIRDVIKTEEKDGT